jgi:TRAP-type C4-dicarboxylate transport system permease small subunit
MSASPPRIHKALDALELINGLIATILFVALTLVVSLQVFTRFVLHIPFIWSEEVARFLFFWVALLGAAMSVRTRRHFVLDVRGAARRSDRKIHLPDLVPDLCVFAFSLLLLAQGVGYAGVGWLRTASNSQVNMGLVYAAIPVFAALSALYAAGNLFVDVTALRERRARGASPPSSLSGPE